MIKKMMNISGAQVLSQEEMKMTKGGGTCGYLGKEVGGIRDVKCGISKEEALFWFAEGGGGSRWCCDSCLKTEYCGQLS